MEDPDVGAGPEEMRMTDTMPQASLIDEDPHQAIRNARTRIGLVMGIAPDERLEMVRDSIDAELKVIDKALERLQPT